jgi:DNA-binding CsgD family transcriptional regulator
VAVVGAERFGDVARRQYRALKPHLRRVIKMQARLDSLAAGNALARACLDRVQAGVVVVDKARRVKLINAFGAQMLGKGRRLSIANQRLACNHPALEEQLGRLVAKACAQPASGGALRTSDDAVCADWLINVLPVPPNHDLAVLLPEPLALVVISEANAATVPIDAYRSLFSLTATEAALLSALVGGSSVADWARHRGTSVATVRTQLRSLFDKTGADSQARLIGLARSVPPIK